MEEELFVELFKKGHKVNEEDISDLTEKERNIYFHTRAAKGLKYKLRRIKVPDARTAEG